jgi:glycosyltransferase involved in cell wall biosynthesis
MMLDEITPLILTYDEAPNIRRTLGKLCWAERIVVIDSGSTDGTFEILESYPQVEAIKRPFDDFAAQCNYGIEQVKSPWVLSLDADYELSEAFVQELKSLAPRDEAAGYAVNFVYRVGGKALRGSLYPSRTVLFKRERARYKMAGHAHRVEIDGQVLALKGIIYHDDRKPLSRWLQVQERYAHAEAEYLLDRRDEKLGFADRLRLLGWPAPLAVFLYTLLLKGCLFDGWPGWHYTLQRVIAEALLAFEIMDRQARDRNQPGRRGIL